MAKAPQRPAIKRPEEFFEAPTRKQSALPEKPSSIPPSHTTTKLPKAEIEALLKAEREKSGMRPAVSDEAIESFERGERRSRDTVPAPSEDEDRLLDFELDLDAKDPSDKR